MSDQQCRTCDGPLVLLGTLGNVAHYRCSDCRRYRRVAKRPGLEQGIPQVIAEEDWDREHGTPRYGLEGPTVHDLIHEEETWLDVMPVLPLRDNTPVCYYDRSDCETHRGVVVHVCPGGGHLVIWRGCLPADLKGLPRSSVKGLPRSSVGQASRYYPLAPDFVRVDLDDSSGFSYALRWWFQNRRLDHEPPWADPAARSTVWGRGVWERHVMGRTTEADKLSLARACRELVEPEGLTMTFNTDIDDKE